MNNMLWKLLAKFLAIPSVTDWLIRRAIRTPYTHIYSRNGSTVYMYRFWLFNAYRSTEEKDALVRAGKKIPWEFPVSMRLHKIMRADNDRDKHDHPWNARTIVLRRWYKEIREFPAQIQNLVDRYNLADCEGSLFNRLAGQTATLKFEEYHRIIEVPQEGVWTLFITYKYRGIWGFKVNGIKVPHDEYFQQRPPE